MIITFAIVFATVVAHGFTIGWLARHLGLAAASRPGVLIVGASPWSVDLARTLVELDVPVTLADRDWLHLRPARFGNIAFYYGEILSEATEHRLDLNPFGYLLALTSNEGFNALVCSDFMPRVRPDQRLPARRRARRRGRPSRNVVHPARAHLVPLGGRTMS